MAGYGSGGYGSGGYGTSASVASPSTVTAAPGTRRIARTWAPLGDMDGLDVGGNVGMMFGRNPSVRPERVKVPVVQPAKTRAILVQLRSH